LYPSEAYVILNGTQPKARADQLTTASKVSLLNPIGRLSTADMVKVEQAIKVPLGLSSQVGIPWRRHVI
jgi:mRNA interferase MazF